MSPLRPWPLLGSRTIAENRIFRLAGQTCRSPSTGGEHEFYVLECGDWVNIVPLTDEGEVVMVRQFRHGTREFTLEVPGGMVDSTDVDPAEAAAREMREETGFEAARVQHLGSIEPNPAIQGNRCHSYLATGLTRVGEPVSDGTEEVEVVAIPLAQVPEYMRRGEITHALVVVAFTWLWLNRGVDPEGGWPAGPNV